jgi:hypothetical protein
MQDRHALNAFLKESGFGTSGDLVYLEPARSRTMEVRRSEKAVVATISTAARDRHGDVIDPGGVRLGRFRKNPVVLYAHDYEGLPVARSLWERVRDGDSGPELVAKPQFHMDTELSREVWALVEKGVLSAWSVGFIPEEWEPLDGDGCFHHREHGEHGERRKSSERPTGDGVRETGPSSVGSVNSVVKNAAGFKVRKWDLLEYSCVPVAANFEALTRELESRRITAPALVKSLAPLGMREPDLVPQAVAAEATNDFTTEHTENTENDERNGERMSRHAVTAVPPSSVGSVISVVRDAVSRGFDLWLSRARGGTRS